MDIVLAAEQIVKALVQRKAKVTAFVPHYAMSGGSLIALAADEIVKLPELKNPALISDEMLILVDSRPRRGYRLAYSSPRCWRSAW